MTQVLYAPYESQSSIHMIRAGDLLRYHTMVSLAMTTASAAEAAASDNAQVQAEKTILVWDATGRTDDELASEFTDFQETLSEEESVKRSVGQHFTLMESVWGSGDEDDAYAEISASDFDAIKRNKEQGLLLKTCYENLAS